MLVQWLSSKRHSSIQDVLEGKTQSWIAIKLRNLKLISHGCLEPDVKYDAELKSNGGWKIRLGFVAVKPLQ